MIDGSASGGGHKRPFTACQNSFALDSYADLVF